MDREFKETEEGKLIIKRFEEMLNTSGNAFFSEEEYEYIIGHYMTKGKAKRAFKAIEAAIEQHPYSTDLLLEKARILFEDDKHQQALEIIEYVEALHPNDLDVMLLKGAVLTNLEKFEEAIHLLSSAVELNTEERDEIYYSIGLTYQSWGRYESAIEYYKKSLELNIEHEDATYELAYCFDITNQLPESVNYYQHFIDNDPFSHTAWYNLGVVHSKMFEWDNAIDAYEYAILIKDDFASAHFNMGNALMNLNKYSEPNDFYKKTIDLEGPTPDVLCCLAASYEKMELFESGISHFKKALKIDPHYHEAIYGIGSCLEFQEKWLEASHFFKKALSYDQTNITYLLALADAEYNTGNVVFALESYEKAAEIDPFNVDLWLNWSFIFFEQQEFERASSIIEQGIEELPEESELYYRNTVYLINDGKYKEAFVFLENALTLNFDKHIQLFDFFTDLETQKALYKIIDQYKNE